MSAEGHHGTGMALEDDEICTVVLSLSENSDCRTSCRSRCQRCILSGRIECQFCKMSSSLVPSSRQRTWTRFSYLQDALPPQTVKTGAIGLPQSLATGAAEYSCVS